MFLWKLWFIDDDDWCCFVIAPTRGRAKTLFWNYWANMVFGEFTDIRSVKIKSADGLPEKVCDTDCPELEALGVRYMTEEEFNDFLESLHTIS